MDHADLLDRTEQPREAVRVAREWLLDCDWAEGEDAAETIRLANAVSIVAAVERHYEGGWIAFAKTEGVWNGLTPREREAFRRETAATQALVADMERDGLL